MQVYFQTIHFYFVSFLNMFHNILSPATDEANMKQYCYNFTRFAHFKFFVSMSPREFTQYEILEKDFLGNIASRI